MPRRQNKTKQTREVGKNSAEFLDLTEDERILLALEMSKAEPSGDPVLELALEMSKNHVTKEDKGGNGDLDAILQLSLNPQEQINKEHREFLAILTKQQEAKEDSQGTNNGSAFKDLQLEELDEEEQMLIALRRSAKETHFKELLKSDESTKKDKENNPLPYQRILSKKKNKKNALSSTSVVLPLPSTSVPLPSLPSPRVVVSETGGYSPYRPIVIDGCNLAWAHGDNKKFSAQGLAIAHKRFQSLGSREIVIFVRNNLPILDEESEKIMDRLRDLKVLYEIPKNRTTAGFHVSHYDDLMIVDYAVNVKGIVVSNDHFEDIIDHSKEFKEQIRYRLLSFTWVGNVLLFPQDPLGKGGPNLKNFLKY